jgi:hypothetical protein
VSRIVVAPGELRDAALILRGSSDAYWDAAVRLAGARRSLPQGWDWVLDDLSAVRGELVALSQDLAEAARTIEERARLAEESDSRWCTVGPAGLVAGATLPGGERVEIAPVPYASSASSTSGPGASGAGLGVPGNAAGTVLIGNAASVASPASGLYPTEMTLGGTATSFSVGMPLLGPSLLGAGAAAFTVGAAYGTLTFGAGSGGSAMEMLGLGQPVFGGNPWATPEMNDIRVLESQLRLGAMTAGPAPSGSASDPSLLPFMNPLGPTTLASINRGLHNINAINSPIYVERRHFTSNTTYETYNGLQ